MKPHTNWHGKKYYFGMHYDLHARKEDTLLGTRCSEKELLPMLKLMAPDFVQTDCKGHAGYTSWFSKTKGASVPPRMNKDALRQWRDVTKELGLPLHCHYSGIWDKAIAAKHPDWCIQPYEEPEEGQGKQQNFCDNPSEKLCPRSPYLDEYMIPQMKELIDRYDVDGFWVDGDMWAIEPCYCARCREAWTAKTGQPEPPSKTTDKFWPVWWTFTLESFNEYVTQYCDAVHAHKKGVLVCSNWLQTFANPGAPSVPTDWISGDNAWAHGMDNSRCEARFLSTRQKHWDIMLWNFTKVGGMRDAQRPWFAKPVDMLKQEASVLLSFGGAVQIYENPGTAGRMLRSGQLIPWQQKRMAEVGKFIKKRRTLCQGSETLPQIAVLHSESHIRATTRGKNLMWGVDLDPVRGAVFALLENHYGVDILDEWALADRLDEFAMVVVPEREHLSRIIVKILKVYVENGGSLVVSGARSFAAFSGSFLGVEKGKLAKPGTYHIPISSESAPFHSNEWRLTKPTTANVVASLNQSGVNDEYQTGFAAATVNTVGKGKVAYLPFSVFRNFQLNRNPMQRKFIGDIVKKAISGLSINVDAPTCVDVALRRKENRKIVHFVNRGTGLPTNGGAVAIDEIPSVGPVSVTMKCSRQPESVKLAFEDAEMNWEYSKGRLQVTIDSVHIHSALVVNGE